MGKLTTMGTPANSPFLPFAVGIMVICVLACEATTAISPTPEPFTPPAFAEAIEGAIYSFPNTWVGRARVAALLADLIIWAYTTNASLAAIRMAALVDTPFDWD